jgi:hypothetical protein
MVAEANVERWLGAAQLRELICHGTPHPPSAFVPDAHEQQAVEEALRLLSRAVFDRFLFVPYLLDLRKRLSAFKAVATSTSGLLESLLRTRDDGQRWMEEVAGNLLSDDAFGEPYSLMRLYLRPTSAAKFLRERGHDLPPQLLEVIEQLLTWSNARLTECGEPPAARKGGRPPEHPAVVAATRVLDAAGFKPSRISAAIGSEIAAVRQHTRKTRNGKSYEQPNDVRRTLRRHRGKNPS